MFVAVATRYRLLPVLCQTFSIIRCSKSSFPRPSDSNYQLIKRLTDRGDYAKAFHLFDHLVKQRKVTVVSLLTILETCSRSEDLERGRQMERLINQSIEWKENIRLQTSLINMYMKCRKIDQAERIFERLHHSSQPDVVVYNAMLKGYLRNQQAERCFPCLDRMRPRVSPDNVTYILLLNACTSLRDVQRGAALHEEIRGSLDVPHVHLYNALIDFYGKINRIGSAEQIFDQMSLRETSTYNSLMKAYLLNQMPVNVLQLFEQMKQSDGQNVGPLSFQPDLITFMAICDACEKMSENTYSEENRPRLFYDPNSLSSFNAYRIVHTHFEWLVDFESNILDGSVRLDIQGLKYSSCDISSTITTAHAEIPNKNGQQLVLDARHLSVKEVLFKGAPLAFQVDPGREALVIEMPSKFIDEVNSIQIVYSTVKNQCTALQWLTKEQTADREYPYMFSQCQAIHARSLYPCQDTPGVKSTYSAQITCPKPLTVLMSALPTKHDEETNTFFFEQKQAIPSYLLAIAVGHLVSADLSDRIRVWTEPSMIERCRHEFEQSESFLTAAEELLGNYQWTRYDFLVLPPSFPYGGMENPCMNFLTPTLLAGDRSLISTIVHEMTHSWTGNLVTNENWEHFWLNEGFTSFIEAKILGKLDATSGKEVRRFHAAQQWQDLKIAVETWGPTHPYTCLVYRLNNVDPDDAYSSVQYYKGAALLWYLEQTIVGSEAEMDRFLQSYIAEFSRRPLNTDDFIRYFDSFFPHVPLMDWHSWLYTPGMPPVTLDFSTILETECRQLADPLTPLRAEEIKQLNPKQMAFFFNLLLNPSSPISKEIVLQIDRQCQMSNYSNCEIRFRWYQLCIRVKYEAVLDEIFQFLTFIGRMKFVKPLYTEFKGSWPEMMPRLRTFFEEQKQFMNPITVKQIESRLGPEN